MPAPKGVSIIICCYNSAGRLPETLSYIAKQQVVDIPWELIIVNNRSSDTTKDVATSFIRNYSSLQVQVLDELKPGLSYARHKGFMSARYEYLLLCDDDNWLATDYVQNAFTILEAQADIGILGGIGEAVADVELPEWFQRNQNSFAVGKLFENGGYVKYVYGAGMVLRKSVYLKALERGFKTLLSDRTGKELSSGGDIELCYLFQLMGWKIFQSDSLTFQHFVEKGKLTDDYKQRIQKGFAKTLLALRPYDFVVSNRTESPSLLWIKEYSYLLKETLMNILHRKEDWHYLKSALTLMLLHQKEFKKNIKNIRAFAAIK
jgi:glycosyltransferase involved in cell wall biosynthesis